METSIRPIVAETVRIPNAARASSGPGQPPFAVDPDRERPRREQRGGEPQHQPSAGERAVAPPADDEAGSHLDLLA